MKKVQSGGQLEVNLSTKRAANLGVLQKIDPSVLEIIGDATHVALYSFQPATTKWERMNIEGALFVTRAACAPFYNVVVLNKNGPDDFKLDIKCIMNIKLQPPYLMLRHATAGAPSVVGLWFHNESERQDILEIIGRSMKSASGCAAAPATSAPFPSSSSSSSTSSSSSSASTTTTTSAAASGAAPTPLDALKKLLASAPAPPASVMPTAAPAASSPAPESGPSSSAAAKSAMLLASLRGGAAPPLAPTAAPGGHVFLTDREIAAKHNNTLVSGSNGATSPVPAPVPVPVPVSVTQPQAQSLATPEQSDNVSVLSSKLMTLLKSGGSATAPKAAVADEAPPAPPVPGAQRIAVSSLFSKPAPAAAAVVAAAAPVPAPAPAPVPAPAPAPAAVLSPVSQPSSSLLAEAPVSASPAPKLLSPSDLTGMIKRPTLITKL